MLLQDKVWGRRDFLKLVGQAGLVSAVPTLASAAARSIPTRFVFRSCTQRICTVIFSQRLTTPEIQIAADWRVVRRKSGAGGKKIPTRF